jgi:hypothetical protein
METPSASALRMKNAARHGPGFPCREKKNGRLEACAMDGAHCQANFGHLNHWTKIVFMANSVTVPLDHIAFTSG